MTNWEKIEQYCGKEEADKIQQYMKWCTKYLKKKGIHPNNEIEIGREILLLLDGKQIEEKTLFVIVEFLVLGEYCVEWYPAKPNWRGVNWKLIGWCEIEVDYNPQTKIVHVLNQKERLTFAELLNRQTSKMPDGAMLCPQ